MSDPLPSPRPTDGNPPLASLPDDQSVGAADGITCHHCGEQKGLAKFLAQAAFDAAGVMATENAALRTQLLEAKLAAALAEPKQAAKVFDEAARVALENADLRERLRKMGEKESLDARRAWLAEFDRLRQLPWNDEDPKMLREQLRVADSAFNRLHQSYKELLELHRDLLKQLHPTKA